MAVDGVPFAIDQTALHSASASRMVAYAAVSGSEGVTGPSDLLVLDSDIPDGNILVSPGAASITNRALGESYQSYIVRAPTATVVPITPTAGTGRTDMVVARVENPYLAGEPWSVPLDPVNGPYAHIRVIENVSPTAAKIDDVDPTMSAIPLARITIPPSTGTITQSMIQDLRWFNQVLGLQIHYNTHCDNGEYLLNTQTSYVQFPTQFNGLFVVPEWATHLQITATFDPVLVYNGSVHGLHASWRFQISHPDITTISTISTDFDVNTPMTSPAQGAYRVNKTFADRVYLPPECRGENITIISQMKHRKDYLDLHDNVLCNNGTNMVATFNFRQTAGGA